MKSLATLLFSFCLALSASAQLNYGGEPSNWSDKRFPDHLSFLVMPELNRAELAAEDAVVDQYKEAPWRFGVEHEVQLNPSNAGSWSQASGKAIWQLGITCPEGTSMSFLFTNYDLPKGAELFIWSADRAQFLGSYNHINNSESGVFPVGLLQSDQAVIELSVPAALKSSVVLELSQIIHGYRSLLRNDFSEVDEERGPFGNSGACNINVNCPSGADWQIEKRSVALIVSGGSSLCSGVMVNNTAQDGTPYFLTANHCLPSIPANVANWVFYFNHESAGCSGSTGPTNQSIAGSVLRARNANSDFALLELNDTPPSSFNVQYAGWDKTDNEATVTGAVGIHHPSGDVKKICFEEDSPSQQNQAGAEVWYINQWESGVTEGGSSGSPLFNQNHRVIGQLYGGFAACSGNVNNGQADWYGRFGVSWDGTSAATRLRDWLDPQGTNPSFIDGYPDGFVAAQIDAAVGSLSGIPSTVCGNTVTPTIQLTNNGLTTLTSCTINYQLNGGTATTIPWTGSLAQNQSTTVNLPAITAANGSNTLTVTVSNPNGVADENATNNSVQVSFTAFTGPVFEATINLTFDDYPEETSWRITQGALVLYTSPAYDNQPGGSSLEISVCLPEGCYSFIMEDDYGDGMCCEYGEGSYLVTNNLGQTVASGGTFVTSETTQFCLGGAGLDEKSSLGFRIYPNPAQENIQLVRESGDQASYVVTDGTGRIVKQGMISGASNSLNVSDLPAGYYVIRLKQNEDFNAKPFVIQR